MAISYDSKDDHPKNQGVQLVQEYTLEELLDSDRDRLNELSIPRLLHTAPHIVASFLNRLEPDERRRVIRLLPEEPASEIIAEMDPDLSAETMEMMRESRAIQILEDLEPDDAADVVEEMDEESRDRLLSKINPKAAAKVRSLLTYGRDTAGGVMNPNVATVRIDMSVDQAIQSIREQREEAAHVYYVYVIDNERHLEGVLNMRDLILAKPNQPISNITETSLKGVCYPDEDKEAVALTMANHNLMALPVVDKKHHLLGVITHDDVIDILQAEATEDIQKLVGAGPDETLYDDISYSITRRSPGSSSTS
jgi:magnesium transporter